MDAVELGHGHENVEVFQEENTGGLAGNLSDLTVQRNSATYSSMRLVISRF